MQRINAGKGKWDRPAALQIQLIDAEALFAPLTVQKSLQRYGWIRLQECLILLLR